MAGKVTTKRVLHVGHDVFVDGEHVGTVTNYGNADWWALRPTRYPLGVWRLQEAAEKLAADLAEDDAMQVAAAEAATDVLEAGGDSDAMQVAAAEAATDVLEGRS